MTMNYLGSTQLKSRLVYRKTGNMNQQIQTTNINLLYVMTHFIGTVWVLSLYVGSTKLNTTWARVQPTVVHMVSRAEPDQLPCRCVVAILAEINISQHEPRYLQG